MALSTLSGPVPGPETGTGGGVPSSSGAVNLLIDRDKVNHFKQNKLAKLIELIQHEG